MSIIAFCQRWLFAVLVLFTTSQHQRFGISIRRSSSSDSSFSSGSVSLLFAAAQDKPFFTTAPFTEPNLTHRTKVCDRFAEYAAGKRAAHDLLSGLELSVGVIAHRNDIFLRLNRSVGNDEMLYPIIEEDPGIFVHILDELAARGNFSWRKSFAWTLPPETNLTNPATNKNFTWTDVFLDAVKRYDVSFGDWVHNQERRKLGISYTVGFFDASTILVQNQVEKVAEFELTAFLRPFSTEVWYLICAVIFFSGVIYWMIDKVEYPHDKINTVVYDTFLTALTVTQLHQYWDPSTHGKRIFGYSAAFWALILASSYTANLASFLVAQQRPVIFAETLEEVQQKDLNLCVRAGAAVSGQVGRAFPGIKMVGRDDFLQVFQTLRGGGCQMMAGRADDFDAFKDDFRMNPECSLEWVGRAAFVNQGGPATLIDTSVYCTSVVRYALDIFMHEMIADGTMDNLWNDHKRSLPDFKLCTGSGLNDVQTLDGNYALDVTDVGGIFIFHGVLVLISVLVTIVESPWRRKRRRKKAARTAAEEGLEHGEDYSGYMAMFRPSMERLHSGRSMRNLVGAEMSNFYQLYSDKDDSFHGVTARSKISESIRQGEAFELPADGLLRSIQLMQTQIDELQRRGEAQRKLSRQDNSIGSPTTKRGKRPSGTPVLPRIDSDDDLSVED